MHAWIHACMHTYHTCLIQMYSHTCLPTNIHYTHIDMISVFPYFCISVISIFVQMRKYEDSRNMEIQKIGNMYLCRQACVCISVWMDRDKYEVDSPSTTTNLLRANRPIAL